VLLCGFIKQQKKLIALCCFEFVIMQREESRRQKSFAVNSAFPYREEKFKMA